MRTVAILSASLIVGCKSPAPKDETTSTTPTAGPLPSLVDLTTTHDAACVVADDERARCWGRHTRFPVMLGAAPEPGSGMLIAPRTLKAPPLAAVRLARDVALGRTTEGRIVVWLDRMHEIAGVEDVDDIALDDDSACIRRDEAVDCWFADEVPIGRKIVETPPRALKLAAGPIPAGTMLTRRDGLLVVGADATASFTIDRKSLKSGVGDVLLEAHRVVPHAMDRNLVRGGTPPRPEDPTRFGDGRCRLAAGRLHCQGESDLDPETLRDRHGRARLVARNAEHVGVGGGVCVAAGGRVSCGSDRDVASVELPKGEIVGLLDDGDLIVLAADGWIGVAQFGGEIPEAERLVRITKRARAPRSAFMLERKLCVHDLDDTISCETMSGEFSPEDLPAIRDLRRIGEQAWLAILPDGSHRFLARDEKTYRVTAAPPPWPTRDGEVPLLWIDGAHILASKDGTARCVDECAASLGDFLGDRKWARFVATERGACGATRNGEVACIVTVEDRMREPVLERPVIEVELPSGFRAAELYASRENVCARSEAHDVACWTHGPSARQRPARREAHWLDLTAWVLDEST